MTKLDHYEETMIIRRELVFLPYVSISALKKHRQSRRDPYHKQRGLYRSFEDAFTYIVDHEAWFSNHKKMEAVAFPLLPLPVFLLYSMIECVLNDHIPIFNRPYLKEISTFCLMNRPTFQMPPSAGTIL